MSFMKHIIYPAQRDIGGIRVRRALPAIQQRAIGPWVFFDHFGPVDFAPGKGINVRPHPHINLATVTYLFEGEIYHRDSLGNAMSIHPGAVNLMVAGAGMTHSERTRRALRETGYRLHGLQLWHALPESAEETAPAFYHIAAADIPQMDQGGVAVRVLMGKAYGLVSPVKTFSDILYLEVNMLAGSNFTLPKSEEIGVYVVEGVAQAGQETLPVNAMSVMEAQERELSCAVDTRLVIIGGKPLGKRFMEWNFISSRKERIAQAWQDWESGKFPPVIGDDDTKLGG